MFLEPQPRTPCDLNDGDFCLAVSDVTHKHFEKEPRVNYKLTCFELIQTILFGYFQQTFPGLFPFSFQQNTECVEARLYRVCITTAENLHSANG